MNIRYQIAYAFTFFIFCVLNSGCNKNPRAESTEQLIATATLAATMAPTEDAVIWHAADGGGFTSVWVRGNAAVVDFAMQQPYLLIPRPGKVWEWREEWQPHPVCDCRAHSLLEYQGDCPIDEESFSVQKVFLVDRITGETHSLAQPPGIPDKETNRLAELSYRVVPLASAGPLLFVKEEEKREYCDGSVPRAHQSFFVYNLDLGKRVEILEPDELEKIKKNEQVRAWRAVEGDPSSSATSASEMELAGIEPEFVGPFNVRISYHFSSEYRYDGTEHDGEDSGPLEDRETESSAKLQPSFYYSGTVRIPAETVPRAFVVHAIAPDVVKHFSIRADPGLGRGWTRLSGSKEELSEMWSAFAERP